MRVGDEVFSVPGVYAGTFKRKGTGWADRTLIELTPADLSRFTVKAGAESFTLVSDEQAWRLEDPTLLPSGFRFDTDGAASLVTAFTKLRVREFVEAVPSEDTTGLGVEAVVITAEPKEAGTSAVTLRIGAARGDDTVWAALSTGDTFTLSKHTAETLAPDAYGAPRFGALALRSRRGERAEIRDEDRELRLVKRVGVGRLGHPVQWFQMVLS